MSNVWICLAAPHRYTGVFAATQLLAFELCIFVFVIKHFIGAPTFIQCIDFSSFIQSLSAPICS